MPDIPDCGEKRAARLLAELDHGSPPLMAAHDAAFWRALLVRYIHHVGTEEGTDFLTIRDEGRWSDDQWAALCLAAAESYGVRL